MIILYLYRNKCVSCGFYVLQVVYALLCINIALDLQIIQFLFKFYTCLNRNLYCTVHCIGTCCVLTTELFFFYVLLVFLPAARTAVLNFMKAKEASLREKDLFRSVKVKRLFSHPNAIYFILLLYTEQKCKDFFYVHKSTHFSGLLLWPA